MICSIINEILELQCSLFILSRNTQQINYSMFNFPQFPNILIYNLGLFEQVLTSRILFCSVGPFFQFLSLVFTYSTWKQNDLSFTIQWLKCIMMHYLGTCYLYPQLITWTEFRRNMLIKACIEVDDTDGDFRSAMLSGRIIIQLQEQRRTVPNLYNLQLRERK